MIVATAWSLVVACFPEVDGETQFILGAASDIGMTVPPVFSGNLKTPNRHVIVRSVHFETILQASVPNEETFVQIWTNDNDGRIIL